MRSDIREGYGLVISVKGGDCFAVARDGRYVRFRVSGAPPRPGEIVPLPAAIAVQPAIRRGVAPLALAATLVLAIGIGAAIVAMRSHPAAYVAIDINPSLELALNHTGRVIGVSPLNPDAVVVLDRFDGGRKALLGLNAREALAEVVRAALEQGFLSTGEENVIQVTVVGSGRGIPGPDELRGEVAAVLEGQGAQAYLRVRSAGSSARNEARHKGVSVNALLLAEEMVREGMAPGEIHKVGAAKIFKASELAGRRKGQEGAPKGPDAAQGRGGSPEDGPRQSGKPSPPGPAESPGPPEDGRPKEREDSPRNSKGKTKNPGR